MGIFSKPPAEEKREVQHRLDLLTAQFKLLQNLLNKVSIIRPSAMPVMLKEVERLEKEVTKLTKKFESLAAA